MVGVTSAWLTFDEVETLYHEFGHALHNIFADGNFASLTGTSVPWDFVELPSQIMENFANEPARLQKFARHYETGEPIPGELIDKLKKSATFMSGMVNIRQLSFGLTDMEWHGKKPEGKSIEDVEKSSDITRKFYPAVEGIAVSPAFSHIFAGGYSAGYYSYKWSEVLDADASEMTKLPVVDIAGKTITKVKEAVLPEEKSEQETIKINKRNQMTIVGRSIDALASLGILPLGKDIMTGIGGFKRNLIYNKQYLSEQGKDMSIDEKRDFDLKSKEALKRKTHRFPLFLQK
jgi:sporulation protein YlmC with PRC-barrel domain